jgi:hypothetical protein
MNLSALQQALQGHAPFGDLSQWNVSPLGGLTGPCTVRVRAGTEDYVIKMVKDNEREIWQRLIPLQLRHVPTVLDPALLSRNILVTAYRPGGTLQSKDVESGVLRDLAHIQNHFNAPGGEGERYEGSTYAQYLLELFEGALSKLAPLRSLGLAIVEDYARLLGDLARHQTELAAALSAMPGARLHHDFREENILARRPQQLIDWGSSYGHGPFLFDPAPFLFGQPARVKVFARHSEICRQAEPAQIAQWLYVATCARFVEFVRYARLLLPDGAAAPYLTYHWQTYQALAEGPAGTDAGSA